LLLGSAYLTARPPKCHHVHGHDHVHDVIGIVFFGSRAALRQT
jgi:hypothetical protein